MDFIINFLTNSDFLFALFSCIGLALGLYFAPYIKDHLLWVKGGIENSDGKLENKELQIAFFSIIAAFMIVSVALWKVDYPEIAYIGVFGGAGILYSINRIAEAYVKSKSNDKDKKEGDF